LVKEKASLIEAAAASSGINGSLSIGDIALYRIGLFSVLCVLTCDIILLALYFKKRHA
jgi:hypothetical protein